MYRDWFRVTSRARERAGTGLATTLPIVAVLVTLLFALAGVALSSLNLAYRMECVAQARFLAESVIASGIERLIQTPSYGLTRSPGQRLAMRPVADRGEASLTFQIGSGLPYSTNNLAGESPTQGYNGQIVPAHSAHLIGTGRAGGVTRTVEVVLNLPPFPYCIASAGPLVSQGNLLVGAIESSDQLSGEPRLPGHVASNGTGPDAMVLGPLTRITGDVRSAGAVQYDPQSSSIAGEIRAYAGPVPLPKMDVASYDPAMTGKADVQQLRSPSLVRPVLQGFYRHQGDLVVKDGLVLDGAALYVDGDLEIEGGVRGVGAVFVTGQTRLRGASFLATDNVAALLSRGRISLIGSGLETSYFQGILYTEGDFQAERVSLLGTLIVHGRTDLQDTRLIHVPDYTRVRLAAPATQTLSFTNTGQFSGSQSGQFSGGSYSIPARHDTAGFAVRNPVTSEMLTGLTLDQAASEIQSILTLMAGFDPGISQAEIRAALAGLRRSSASSGPADTLEIDPSRFLRVEERARIVLWRER